MADPSKFFEPAASGTQPKARDPLNVSLEELFPNLTDLTKETALEKIPGEKEEEYDLDGQVWMDGGFVWTFCPAGDALELPRALARVFRFFRRALKDPARDQGPQLTILDLGGIPGLLVHYLRRDAHFPRQSAVDALHKIQGMQEAEKFVRELSRFCKITLPGQGVVQPTAGFPGL